VNRSEWQLYKRQRNVLFQPLRHLPKEADGGGGTTARRGKSVSGNLDARCPKFDATFTHDRYLQVLSLYCTMLHCIEAAGSDQISKTKKVGRAAYMRRLSLQLQRRFCFSLEHGHVSC
jgi:hypothetical protein